MVILGIVLVLAGAGLMVAEAHLPTAGILGLLGVVSLVAGGAIAAVAGSTPVVVVMAAGGAGLAGSVVTALALARVGPRTWAALALAPGYVVWKSWIQVRAIAGVRRGRTDYGATPRA